jgi:nucleoside-diphosphate-sugar epimerase
VNDTGTAVVVGGLGVIGSAVATALRGDGWDVVVVTNDRDNAGRPGLRYGDLLLPDTLPAAVAGAAVVVQAATFPTHPVERPEIGHTFHNYDARGTAALVAAAQDAGCARYVYFSGGGVPESPEGAAPHFQAMYAGEQAVLTSALEGVCLRPTMVYGPTDRSLNQIIALGRRGGRVPVLGDGRQLHQPIYVDDVGEIARQAARIGGPQGVFELGGPDRMPFEQVIATALGVVGLERELTRIPLGPARFAARFLQRLPGRPLTVAGVDFASRDDIADLTALRAAFTVELTPFEDGLRRYLGETDRSVPHA